MQILDRPPLETPVRNPLACDQSELFESKDFMDFYDFAIGFYETTLWGYQERILGFQNLIELKEIVPGLLCVAVEISTCYGKSDPLGDSVMAIRVTDAMRIMEISHKGQLDEVKTSRIQMEFEERVFSKARYSENELGELGYNRLETKDALGQFRDISYRLLNDFIQKTPEHNVGVQFRPWRKTSYTPSP